MAQEEILLRVDKVTNKFTGTGGLWALHFTNKRIVVDYSQAVGPAGVVIGGILGGALGAAIGGAIAQSRQKESEKARLNERTIEEILASDGNNYAISYDEIRHMTLKRKILAMGYSELKIEYGKKKSRFHFRREQYDTISSILANFFHDRIEIK